MKEHNTQAQIVFLPYVSAVDPRTKERKGRRSRQRGGFRQCAIIAFCRWWIKITCAMYSSGAMLFLHLQNQVSGFATRRLLERTTRAMRVFFVPHSHTLSMVGCMGAEQSAPGFLVTGIANPVQSATSEICNSSGGNIKPTREDAAMLATTPTQNPLFVWRFYSGQNATYHTVTATSEREARLQLPAVRLVFVARIRTEGVNHA